MIRIAYLVTHPIQYQAPLLRRVAAAPEFSLRVFFGSDFSVRRFTDPGFGHPIEWDVPLLEGYESEVLPDGFAPMRPGASPSFLRPFNRDFGRRLAAGRFDYLWIHGYNRAFHWVAILTAVRLGVKVLIRDEVSHDSRDRPVWARLLKRALFPPLAHLVHGFLTIGTLNQQFYLSQKVPPGKLFPMPYAVDNAYFRRQVDLAAPARAKLIADLALPEGPVILSSAKLIPRKRPIDLLLAYARLRERSGTAATLLFAGDGELRGALEAEIAHRRLTGVRLLGFQTQAQLAALYGLADILVLPSEREPWGLVVNEAMNAGCAIVASDRVGAAADLVQSGENGYCYPVGSVDRLSTILEEMLRDARRLHEMGQASLRIIDTWSFEEDLEGLRRATQKVVPTTSTVGADRHRS